MNDRFRFRSFPDVGPAGKVSILGPTRCSAQRMFRYAVRRNPAVPDAAELYAACGRKYGVRGDVAYCQAMYDTRTWMAQPGSSRGPLSVALWGHAGAALRWTEERLAHIVDLHIRCLYAIAVPPARSAFEASPDVQELLGPWSGAAPCWEDLNGRWADPGVRYGQDIVAIWRNMMAWKDNEEGTDMDDASADGRLEHEEGEAEDKAAAASERVRAAAPLIGEGTVWLRERGLLPSPAPQPRHAVTWEELGRVLRLWEQTR